MIERKEYMNLLEKWRDKKAIKVVTGIRRCGKSSLLRMFREKLLSDGVSEEQVQNLNFEDLDNEPFLDYKILYAHVQQNLCPDKMNYLFFDEIQMVENFQKVIDSLFLLDNVDIYVTGSNAYLLSGEIAPCSPEDTSKSNSSLSPSENSCKRSLPILPESSPIANTSNWVPSHTFPKSAKTERWCVNTCQVSTTPSY